MLFQNIMTLLVTEKDNNLLLHSSDIIRTFCRSELKAKLKNPKWKRRSANCHSIVRFLSFYMEDCQIADGYLVGIKMNFKTKQGAVELTEHSWIFTPDGAIIDPYPMGIIGIGTAILVPVSDYDHSSQGSDRYLEDDHVKESFDIKKAWKTARSFMRIVAKNSNE